MVRWFRYALTGYSPTIVRYALLSGLVSLSNYSIKPPLLCRRWGCRLARHGGGVFRNKKLSMVGEMPPIGTVYRTIIATAVCAVLFVVCAVIFAREVYRIATPCVAPLEASYVIVLGGGTKRGGGLGTSAKERARSAAFYMTSHSDCRVVVSGGRGRYGEEAESTLLKDYMLALYVLNDPAAGGDSSEYAPRILEEGRSHDTIENMTYSARVIMEDMASDAAKHTPANMEAALEQNVLIATSGYHLARAQYIARRLGYTHVSGIAAPTPLLSLPKAYIREILAWVKLDLTVLFTGKPGAL